MNNTAATLASSDGWMPNPPMPNHRRDPLIGRAKSTATSRAPTTARATQTTWSFL